MVALHSLSPLKIEQDESGYRYSIEPFLLADFVSLSTHYRIIDVGTGCGIIPLLLLTRGTIEEIIGIEVQKSLYDLAVKNISKNGAFDRVQLIHGNFTNLKRNTKDRLFDLIISNPPYRKLNTGRINPNQEKAIAKHELLINLESLITRAGDYLKSGGVLTLAYPPIRLAEILGQLITHKLFPSRIRFIHSSYETEARIFLIDAVKEQRVDLNIEPPFYIYNKDGSYSKEMKKIYASFNYFSRTNHIQEK